MSNLSEEEIINNLKELWLDVLLVNDLDKFLCNNNRYRKSIEKILDLYNKEKDMYKNTGKLVRNKIDNKIGILLRELETGQIQVVEKIQPYVINTHNSWKTLEVLEDE
ncbi:MAG: hypothetical protein IKG42_04860 [Clostridia bacterium]|nr:hypothetical protein [Clostridia bacterium]